MPGTNAGTGEPVTFRCQAERLESDYMRGMREHRPLRTGRSKPYRRIGQGIRTMTTAHEYRCSCGHTGWSAHVDVVRLPRTPDWRPSHGG
jgi:hypothetical protein